MRIRNMAIYFTDGVLWFPQQCISTLDLVLNLFVPTPPAAAMKGVFGDTPNPGKGLRPLHSRSAREKRFQGCSQPRQKASPSALPFCTRKRFQGYSKPRQRPTCLAPQTLCPLHSLLIRTSSCCN